MKNSQQEFDDEYNHYHIHDDNDLEFIEGELQPYELECPVCGLVCDEDTCPRCGYEF